MTEENGKVETPIYDITKFKLTKVLNNNTNRKTIAVLGTFPDISETDLAVVLLEKNAFTEKDLHSNEEKGYFSEKTKLETEFINNIYGSFQCFPPSDINGVKTTIIYPATDKHIEKHVIRKKYLINETSTMYENITEPHLKSKQFTLDWVYNILDHKSEEDRIVFEDKDPDSGFVLLPDLKWDGKKVETLYLLGLTNKRDIKSLRDINASHLPLLRNMRDAGCEAIEKKYGIPSSQLRIYFHYQPSFYHLHVHYNPLGNDAPGIYCEKSHLLETVINNLELVPDYYQKATLPFVVFEGDSLLECFESEMEVRKKIKTDE